MADAVKNSGLPPLTQSQPWGPWVHLPDTSKYIFSYPSQSSGTDDEDGRGRKGKETKTSVTLQLPSWLNTLWEIRGYSSFPQKKRKCLKDKKKTLTQGL